MCAHNPTSRAWAGLIALCDLAFDELNKYGLTSHHPRSPDERRLAVGDYNLILTLGVNEISASIENNSIPRGRVPKERIFTVKGDANNPVLVEIGGNPKQLREVFEELAAWLRDVARLTPNIKRS